MTDVSSWSPVDESNTAAPPDGWPEFMMPSGVNNCGRMMMGAVRRMYDQQISGTIVLPYLKLSGGTVTGAVSIGGGLTTTSIVANTVYATTSISTGGAISASGAISAGTTVTGPGGFFGSGWAITGSGGNVNLGTGTAGNLASLTFFANSVSAQGNIGATGNISGNGISAAGNISAGGNVTIGGVGYVGGIPFGNVGGWFKAYAGGQFNDVQSNGFITSSGAITAGGSIWAHNAAGNFGLTSDGDYWLRFRSDMGFHFQNSTANCWWQIGPTPSWIMTTNGFCYAAANSVGGLGDYVNISDRRTKEEITPATQGLPEVLQLQPVMFRRTAEAAPLADAPAWELGFVAQDVAPVLPEAVSVVPGPAEVTDPLLGVSVGSITAAIVNALKTIDARLTAGGL